MLTAAQRERLANAVCNFKELKEIPKSKKAKGPFVLKPGKEFWIYFEEQRGKEIYPLLHIFNEPYSDFDPEEELERIERGREYAKYLDFLYDRHINRVFGYSFPNNKICWELIPFQHKQRALKELFEMMRHEGKPRIVAG